MKRKTVFYLIPDSSLKARDLYACRIIEKAFNNQHKVYIYTRNQEESQTIDTQLWTFRDISFVPHVIYNAANLSNATTTADDSTPPILIGHIEPPPDFSDILINLNSTIPAFHQQFAHIIEVVPNDEQLRAAARERYKQYQQQGYTTETHNL